MTTMPVVLPEPRKHHADFDHLDRLGGMALWGVAVVFLAGTFIDLGVLWGLQRSSQPQWEFVALSSTAEGMARPILAIGLMFAGSILAGWRQRWLLSTLSLATISIAVFGIGIALLIGSDYVALAPQVEGDQLAALRSVAIKGAGLGALYAVILAPLGIYGLRKPKNKKLM